MLTQAFDAADLVGKPISVSAFVHAAGGASLPFGATTFTYTPYLLLGQGDGSAGRRPDRRRQRLPGRLHELPARLAARHRADAVDRPAAPGQRRAAPRAPDLRSHRLRHPPAGRSRQRQRARRRPRVTDFDVTTVNVLPGRVALEAFGPQQDRLAAVQSAPAGAAARSRRASRPADRTRPISWSCCAGSPTGSRARHRERRDARRWATWRRRTRRRRSWRAGYLVRPVVASPRVVLAIGREAGRRRVARARRAAQRPPRLPADGPDAERHARRSRSRAAWRRRSSRAP